MATRVVRPSTSPPYPTSGGTRNVASVVTAGGHQSAAFSVPPTDFHWGYMITQDGMINYPAAQNATAKAAFASIPNALMQAPKDHFGVYPVQYVPGAFDWGGDAQGVPSNGIDDGVALIEAYRNKTNGHLMMQLYGIPGWQGGQAGNNFTSLAPDTLQHEQDYADDCARIALRYNGTAGQPNIEYFAFWNENKGMDSYDATARQKNIRIYNKVYDAVKAVRPDAKIGGIYSKFISWEVGMGGAPASNYGLSLTYNGGFVDARVLDEYYEWRRDAHGYDFIAVDVWTGNDNHTSSTPVHNGITQHTQMMSKFPAVFAWIRSMFPGMVPIICTETYIQGKGSGTGSPAETWTAADLEDWMIEVLTSLKPYGPGWLCQWGEAVEPPPPINYSTGAASGLIAKLIAYEASL